MLDDAQFEVPLVLVNREARSIALAWVREQGIELRSRENRQYPIFGGPFAPMRDALYVALDKWFDFLCEPDARRFEPDLFEPLVDLKSDLTRVALPEALLRTKVTKSLLWNKVTSLSKMFQYFFNLKLLFIVVNAQPDL